MTSQRIGYTLWPPNFDLAEPGVLLDEAESLGVDTVEIPFFATRLIANGAILEPVFRHFDTQMRGRRLGYSTHALLTINLMDAPDRMALHETLARACIELTARFGARNMVLHCGLAKAEGPAELEAAYARQRESLSRLADFAAGHGVRICLETIWSNDKRETALPSRLAAEIRAVDHAALCATLDYAHSALQCARTGADLMEEVTALAPLAAHLHLNDCFGVERGMWGSLPAEALAYGSGDLHMPLGWGSLPWDRLMTEPDYPDDVILNQELHPTFWHALSDDVVELRRLGCLMARQNSVG
ncbi:MAG TPA: sugar phosphate isomerase/epimerase family protein [Thermohalobaculum sp.]|nr:sugar phosphate isomerase/epimerase family protein [Thermohalobaculum sp.]